MMSSRYEFAASESAGKKVLEIACGSGQGLGLVRNAATSLVGSDVDPELLAQAKAHYRSRVSLIRQDAAALAFQNGSFDVVGLFEASYYLRDLSKCVDEIRRVLTPSGVALFVSANPEREDFIRSPYSHRYYSAGDFRDLLTKKEFDVMIEGAFPMTEGDAAANLGKHIRRTLARLGLVPRTLRGRALLKRVLYGRLEKLPAEVTVCSEDPAPRLEIDDRNSANFKVLYVTATKRSVEPDDSRRRDHVDSSTALA